MKHNLIDASQLELEDSRIPSSCGSGARAKPFTTHWTMTMCAASSPWGWIISKSDSKKGWY